MKLMMFAGAAALIAAGPAFAKPGNGHGNGYGQGGERGYMGDYGKGRGHGHGRANAQGYGAGGCSPGLAKKYNGCLPPGQAKKLYRGAHFPPGFGTRYSYRQIPYDLRRRYGLAPDNRYYYSNGYLYRVDPRTMLVQQIISALLNR